jgi:hypothetical protein
MQKTTQTQPAQNFKRRPCYSGCDPADTNFLLLQKNPPVPAYIAISNEIAQERVSELVSTPSLMQHLSNSSVRQIAAHYDIQSVAKKIEALYQSLQTKYTLSASDSLSE